MKWRVCSKGQTYDSGNCSVVYFDHASGRTHLINEVADWLLAELTTNPLTTEELLNRFMSHSKGITVSEAEELVKAQIRALQSFDLIEVLDATI